MSVARHHAEWLSLVETSGPFLSMPVLLRVFPQGLDQRDPAKASRLREAYEDWLERGTKQPAVHHAWICHVLTELLEYPPEFLVEGQAIPPGMEAVMANFGETLRPDYVLLGRRSSPSPPVAQAGENPSQPHDKPMRPDSTSAAKSSPSPPSEGGEGRGEVGSSAKPLLLIEHYAPDQDLEKPVAGKTWKASPGTRMMELLHAADVPLGLLTNGEQWMIVSAPRGETTGFASWYADLWMQEPLTLRAFHSLLHLRRFLGVAEPETLAALYAESSKDQQEVTDQLGYQVRRAVEMLVQAFDRIDTESDRKLLAGVKEKDLYDSALTIMMRLVFLFSADERGLLLLGDPLYDQHYAVSTLSELLRERADQHGEEVLERRHDAWCRLLATFRAVHAGVEHEAMRLPPYGGTLFDPDRYPFLEGRAAGTQWQTTPAKPLPINNRVVLHLLEALQVLRVKVPGGGPVEARRLSFRALDIEQIGHVYEGLLDHTAKRANEVILGLAGSKKSEPEIPLAKLEELAAKDKAAFVEFLKDETGRSEKALGKDLEKLELIDDHALLIACGQDPLLAKRVRPFAALLREDDFGQLVVITAGSVYVTAGSDRRSTGTHYTPRSLTEPIVQHTLEPLAYTGPAEGKPKAEWKLKSPREILALKVCDMTMGSGAFLVQTCRYLAERLVEAWEKAEREMRGAGGENRELRGAGGGGRGAGETNYADPKLSGTGSLEVELGLGGAMLPGHEKLSEGGTLRTDQPDSAGGQFRAGVHRGGTRSELDQGISESPEHRAGLAARSGNPPAAGAASGTAQGGANEAAAGNLRANQPDALTPAAGSRTQTDLNVETEAGSDVRENPLPGSRSPHPVGSPPPAPRSPPPGQPLLVMPDGSLSTGSASEYLLPVDDAERLTLARRYVADRCLYGVDINPMAVEMAKLSLWLITLQRDRPFTFLDHALKCGDSLFGVSSVQQIENFSLRPGERQVTFATANLFRYVDEASAKRRALEDMPSNDHTQIKTKNRLHAEAEAATAKVKALADCLIALELRGLDGDAYEDQRTAEAEKVQLLMKRDADASINSQPTTINQLSTHAREQLRGRRPFHWPVEFPEVFARGGFDSFVGNPPFMGGHKLEPTFGKDYRRYLVEYVAGGIRGLRGTADLCAYFFRRASSVLRDRSTCGLLATNTIAQGDTRAVGLDWLLSSEFVVIRAVPSQSWPGAAHLEIAIIWLFRGSWAGSFALDGIDVSGIASDLTELTGTRGNPFQLVENSDLGFEGVNTMGLGFVLDPDEAQELICRNTKNRDVLFPYLNGQDLNSREDQSPSRWIINFRDLPLSRQECPKGYTGPVASDFPDCLRIVEERVRPERLSYPDDSSWNHGIRSKWWQFALWRPALRAATQNLKYIFARSKISGINAIAIAPTDIVFSNAVTIFAFEDMAIFGILQSSIHTLWIEKYSSSMRNDVRYTLASCFGTFPRPSCSDALRVVAKTYNDHRKSLMMSRHEGLTATYNRFHDRGEQSADIARLRALHVEMDQAVAAAYGWSDLDLGHGFHATKQGERYTLSDPARRTVLDRLLALNHQRYAEEVKAGLHEKGAKKAKKARGGSTAASPETGLLLDPQQNLFA